MEHTTAAAPPRAHEDERLRRMDALARDVLRLARNTLLVHLRFLDAALSRFTPERADGGRIATDGQVLRYDPQYVLLSYRDERERPTRDFLHLVLHCAFRHAFVDPRLDRVCWDLACDIAAECAIDSLGLPCVAAQRQAQQQPIVQRLLREGVPLTAEKIYRYFKNERCLEADMLRALREPFLADEHDLWYLDLPAQQRDGERAEEPGEAGEADDADEPGGADAPQQDGGEENADADGDQPGGREETELDEPEGEGDAPQQDGGEGDADGDTPDEDDGAPDGDETAPDEGDGAQDEGESAPDGDGDQPGGAPDEGLNAPDEGERAPEGEEEPPDAQGGVPFATELPAQGEEAALRQASAGEAGGRTGGAGSRAPLTREQLEELWSEIARHMKVDLETGRLERGSGAGAMMQNLLAVTREPHDYADFLRRFAVLGEHIQINDDEFDYIYYTYGLHLYGKTPLIEPLEYKEVRRIREFVIAIDTSGSVKGEQVQRFIQKTYNILLEQESFFTKINLHIVQCDAAIQEAQKITSREEFDAYLASMTLKGFGGTDFRPVFAYVDRMIEQREFTNLRGLIYFTDGEGIFPARQPAYETAFVFVRDDYETPKVPVWAIRLVLDRDGL